MEHAHAFREQLDPAIRARGLRRAVLVEVPAPLDVQARAVEVHVAPLQASRFARAHPGPEKKMHKGVVRQVRSHADRLGAPASDVEAEALALEPTEDALALLRREWVRTWRGPLRPLQPARERIDEQHAVVKCLGDHGAERGDVPESAERLT
ncbi:MAG: hypothetical protein U0807_10500 [Candidatus Binatia bacterium]